MAYAFVQQVASAGSLTASSSLSNPAASVTSSDLLILAVVTSTTNAALLTVSSSGDTWQYGGSCNGGGAGAVAFYFSLNAAGGSTTVSVTSPGTDLYSTDLWEYSGIATSGALITTQAASNITAAGTVGANALATSAFNIASVPALFFSACYDFQNTGKAPPSAGTSPIAFNARASVWAGNNSGGTLATLTSQDTRITSTGNYQSTFGTTSTNNNSYDTMGIFSMVFAEIGGGNAAAVAWLK